MNQENINELMNKGLSFEVLKELNTTEVLNLMSQMQEVLRE